MYVLFIWHHLKTYCLPGSSSISLLHVYACRLQFKIQFFESGSLLLLFALTVGGIYTVIRTKAAVTVDELGDQYCLIGPYNESCVRTEVEEAQPLEGPMSRTIKQMKDNGFKVITHVSSIIPASRLIGFTPLER